MGSVHMVVAQGPLNSFSQGSFVQGPGWRGQARLAAPRGSVGTAGRSGSQCPGHYLPRFCCPAGDLGFWLPWRAGEDPCRIQPEL